MQVWAPWEWYVLSGGAKYNGRTVLIAKDDAVYEFYTTKYRNKPQGNPGVGPAIGFVQADCHGAAIECQFLDEDAGSYEHVKKSRLRRAQGKSKWLVDFCSRTPVTKQVVHRLKWVTFVVYASDGVHLNVENVVGDPGNASVKTLWLSEEKPVKRKNKTTGCSRVSMPCSKKPRQAKAKPKAKDEAEHKAKAKAKEEADSAPKDEAEPKVKAKTNEEAEPDEAKTNEEVEPAISYLMVSTTAPKEVETKAKAKEEAPKEETKVEAEPETSQNKTTVDIGVDALCPECKRPTTSQRASPACKKSYHTVCMLSFNKARNKICKTCYELGAMCAQVRKWREDVHLHDPFETDTPQPFDAFTRDYFNVLRKDKQKDKQTKQKDKQAPAPAAAALPEGIVNENAYRCVSFDTGVSCFRTGV